MKIIEFSNKQKCYKNTKYPFFLFFKFKIKIYFLYIIYKKNKMSENNEFPPIEQLDLNEQQGPPPAPPSPPSAPPSPPPSAESDKDSCECDDTPIEIPDCKPTCVPITLELSPVISLLVNKPKVCVKNMAVCKPKFFLNQ